MASQVWDDDGRDRVARQRQMNTVMCHGPREVEGPGRLAGSHISDSRAADGCEVRSKGSRYRYRYLVCRIAYSMQWWTCVDTSLYERVVPSNRSCANVSWKLLMSSSYLRIIRGIARGADRSRRPHTCHCCHSQNLRPGVPFGYVSQLGLGSEGDQPIKPFPRNR
jgi:hypothetical protein